MSVTATPPDARPSTKPRTDWVDMVKGVAIVLVVFGHAWRGSEKAGLFDGMPSGLFDAVDARIYAFHMPLFFLLSGLFLLPSLERSAPGKFFTSRVTRLLWPLLLWTYLFVASKLVAGSFANKPLEAGDIPLFPIPGKWQFWFLWALFLMHITLLVLRPLLTSETRRTPALWGLFAFSIVGAIVAGSLPDDVNRLTNDVLSFLPYFVAGLLIGNYKMVRPASAALAAAGLAVFAVGVAVQPWFEAPALALGLGLVLSLSLMAAMSRLSSETSPAHAGLLALGKASMPIFLAHTIFTASIRIVLQKVGIDFLPIHLVVGVGLGIALPMIMNVLIHRYAKPQWFGV